MRVRRQIFSSLFCSSHSLFRRALAEQRSARHGLNRQSTGTIVGNGH